jgi:hypothetical protein
MMSDQSGRGAWHGDPILKATTLAKMAAHRVADDLIRGTYWDGHRGCAVGCLTERSDGGHETYPDRWGIPAELAWLEDTLFEGLPHNDAMSWPERFLGAIQPGADLSRVYRMFEARLMLDPERGNIARCGGFPDVEAAVRQVGDLCQRAEVSEDEWSAAWSAESAAWSAESARAAAWSAESARAAAWSAESARAAAWSAESARAAAESAEWSAAEHYRWMANVLIESIQAAPMLAVTR